MDIMLDDSELNYTQGDDNNATNDDYTSLPSLSKLPPSFGDWEAAVDIHGSDKSFLKSALYLRFPKYIPARTLGKNEFRLVLLLWYVALVLSTFSDMKSLIFAYCKREPTKSIF